MDYEIGDGDELADMAEKLLKGEKKEGMTINSPALHGPFEPMELGGLYPEVLRALARPEKRIVSAKGRNDSPSKNALKAFSNKLKVSRRFDIEDDLLRTVFKEPSWAGLTENKGNLPVRYMTENIMQAHDELRLPFKHCWLEFNAEVFNDEMKSHGWSHGSIAVEIEETKEQISLEFDRIGVFCFQSKDEQTDFFWFASMRETSLIHMGILGRSFNSDLPPVAWEPRQEDRLRQMSLLLCGMDFQDEPISEAASGYKEMVLGSQMIEFPEVCGVEATRAAFEEHGEPFAPYITRVAWETLRVLNYPWVVKEQARVENQKKGKRPIITACDSYYRCKIVLPKEDGIETRSTEPRQESYGKKQHQVRGHWRVYKDEFGDVRNRTWIREHRRGDPKLGVVLKDYVLTDDKDKKDDLED